MKVKQSKNPWRPTLIAALVGSVMSVAATGPTRVIARLISVSPTAKAKNRRPTRLRVRPTWCVQSPTSPSKHST